MKNNNFRSGDLVRIKSPRITSAGKRRIVNKQTGLAELKRVYRIEGMSGLRPYGKFLARKRFVCIGTSGGRPLFYLYDNYKPEFLGKGYRVEFIDPSVLEKIGKIIDSRKLPNEALTTIERQASNNSVYAHYFNDRGLSTLEKIKNYNEAPILIQHEDPGIAYALMVGSKYSCYGCGNPFTNKHTEIIPIDNLNLDLIKERLERITGQTRKKIHVFPAGYSCMKCGWLHVLASWGDYRDSPALLFFENMSLGETAEFIKGE